MCETYKTLRHTLQPVTENVGVSENGEATHYSTVQLATRKQQFWERFHIDVKLIKSNRVQEKIALNLKISLIIYLY